MACTKAQSMVLMEWRRTIVPTQVYPRFYGTTPNLGLSQSQAPLLTCPVGQQRLGHFPSLAYRPENLPYLSIGAAGRSLSFRWRVEKLPSSIPKSHLW